MDLEDNETVMNSFDSQVEELRGTIESLEAQLAQNQTQMSDMEARLEDSKAQVELISYTKIYQIKKHFHHSVVQIFHFQKVLKLNVSHKFISLFKGSKLASSFLAPVALCGNKHP